MSSPKGKRDIVRLRTFADDVERAKNEKGVSEKVAAAVLPQDTPKDTQGVFLKVKKKSLDLKANPNQGTTLDADGITFDEEVAQQVTEQAYEEHKSISDGATFQEPSVQIRQTDAVDTIAENPISTEIPPKMPAMKKQPVPIVPDVAPVVLNTKETIDQIEPDGSLDDIDTNISNDDVTGGEFVTDKKRASFKLFPAMGQAVTDWFVDTKEQIQESQREKYTVSKVEDRTETIKAAAQKKTFVPEEDYSTVAQRLKDTKKVKQESTPVIIKPKQEIEASWTHTTDRKEVESEIQPTNVAPAAPVVSVKPTPPPSEPVTPTPKLETPLTTQTSTAPAALGVAQTIPQAEKKGFTMPNISLPSVTAGREFLPSPVLAIVVVLMAVLSGVGTSLYFFWQPEPESVVPQATTSPLFTAELQTSIAFSESHAEIMSTLLSAINSNPGSLYMYFVREIEQELVAPSEVMRFLAPQAPGSFTRSITNVSFGAFDNRPFMVLRVNNFDNAFSGMLAWEQTMSADLSPLFGSVVTESFDPQARTDSQTRSAFFRDIVASNLSGRLLADEKGEDRIIYTFIDKQTIVITTDRLQLTNVLPLIR